ncbi:cupin domain-containing protein [Bdellovibrio bacteriovorus]|uniref:cupin domain-containing protein n=1 Tax=Bdellovibrio bacteriovorus TaxID=959 RepID=UPI0035A59DF2
MATQQTSASPQKPNPSTAFAKVSGTLKSLNFSSADEIREFPNGRLELVRFGEAVVGRAILQPGWRWSKSVKEIAQTDSCEAPHFQYHVSGVLRIKMDDGTEIDCKPGDVSLVPPGHDAWVVGDEPVVIVDFQGMVDYAIQAHKH